MSFDSSAGASVVSADPLVRTPAGLDLLREYVRGTLVTAEMELRKLRHDASELLTRAVQPALWLLIFGQAFSQIRVIPSGEVSYLAFMTPGILAQSVMFISIFYGLTIILDRDQGILQKFLVLPLPRASFVTGKGLSAGVRALSQGVVVLLLALVLGVQVRWSVGAVVGSLLTVVVGASFFATVSMLLAIAVKTRERFMGLGQVVTMPLFFASNAIYPVDIMPGWLQLLAHVNPLSYMVDLLRGYLVLGSVPNAGQDWLVLLVLLVVVQLIAGRAIHTIVR